MGSRSGRGRIVSERAKDRLTRRRRSPSRSSAILFVIEGTLRRVGRVLRLLEPLLELAVEELALLALCFHALLEPLLDLSGARAQLVERGAEIGDRARRRRRLVRDEGAQLGVERELGLAAGALDGEGFLRHAPNLTARLEAVKRPRRRRCAPPRPIWACDPRGTDLGSGGRGSVPLATPAEQKERGMTIYLAIVAALLSITLVVGPVAAQGKPELTVALSSFSTEVLDPVLGGHIVKYYLSLMFDYLVGTTPDGLPSKDGGLATRWELSQDHRRWTFHLRKGVKFHTGEEVTSEDVKWSLQRAIGKRSTTGYAGPLRTLIQDIETPAPDRVVIVTKEPTLIIPTYLSRSLSTEGMVLPKKYIEANGDDVFARKPVGSGPYRFVEQVTGSHIKLTAVDSHWRIGAPKYKTVTFKLVSEETTRIALLRRGEADVADVSRERVKELEKEGFPVHMRKEEALIHVWWILGPDGRTPPTNDKRVREALNLAIDRNEIAQSIFGGYAEPAAIPMGLTWAFKDVGFKVTPDMAYAYDPARAKKLLADAGLAGGFTQDVYAFQLPGLPEGKAFAEAMAGYWEKIGVKSRLIPVDYPAFRKMWVDRKAPGAVGYYNVANRDWIGAYAFLEKQGYTPSKLNDTVNDPEVDGMLSQVLRQTDRDKINALMRNVYTRLRSEHHGVPVVFVHSPYAASKTLGKWNPGSVMYDLFLDELARK